MTARLEEILAEHGVPFRRGGEHRHVRGDYVGIDCGRCGPGSMKFHLGIHRRLLYAVCWRCGKVRLRDALRDAGVPASAIRGLVPDRGVAERPEAERSRPRVLREPPGLGPLLDPHRKYLRGRGFDPDYLERTWGLRGFGRRAGQLAWRIYAPVVFGGRAVSWHARSLSDEGRRWTSAPDEERVVDADRVLYGWDLVRRACVLVEGPADAWRIGPGAAAVLGLRISEAQLSLLAGVPRRAICFDAEPAAQRRAAGVARALASAPGETILIELETGGDPAEASEAEIRQIRRGVLGV